MEAVLYPHPSCVTLYTQWSTRYYSTLNVWSGVVVNTRMNAFYELSRFGFGEIIVNVDLDLEREF